MTRLSWLLLGIALLAGAFALDGAVESWVNSHQHPSAFAAARTVSRFTAWHWLMGALAAIALVAWMLEQTATLRVLVAMALVCSVSGLLADTLRSVTGRVRPKGDAVRGWYGPAHLGDWDYSSFPSGHATASWGLVGPVVVLRRRLGLACTPLPVAVSASRVYLGAHHLSDVVAGALLAGCVTFAWWRLRRRWVVDADSS